MKFAILGYFSFGPLGNFLLLIKGNRQPKHSQMCIIVLRFVCRKGPSKTIINLTEDTKKEVDSKAEHYSGKRSATGLKTVPKLSETMMQGQ